MLRAPSLMTASAMVVALAACSGPIDQAFDKTDRDNINKLIQEFITAYNAKDAAKDATLFAGGAVVMPPNAPTVRGAEFVQQYYVNRFAQGASDLVLEPRDIAGSGALAYTSGDYRLKMAPQGGPEQRDRGKFLFILRDFSGNWRLEYLMFSSEFAAPPPTS